MLKRKISETLKEWKEQPNHSPLVIMGIRQCGKTYISQLFAEENYKHVVYINFIKQKRRKEAIRPIRLTLLGILIFLILQPAKALSPILVTLLVILS